MYLGLPDTSLCPLDINVKYHGYSIDNLASWNHHKRRLKLISLVLLFATLLIIFIPAYFPSVRCQVPGGRQLHQSEHVILRGEGIPQTSDVIFVISHGACNRDVINQIPHIAANLERSLKLAGLPYARFGLVGRCRSFIADNMLPLTNLSLVRLLLKVVIIVR